MIAGINYLHRIFRFNFVNGNSSQMSFVSFHFIVFLPVVLALFFILPYFARWLLVLVASYYFYMSWEPWYILIVLFSTVASYLCGIQIELTHGDRRRVYLILGIVANLSVLFVFKYYNFINGNLRAAATSLGGIYGIPDLDFLLPVGISFITFQAIGYLIDVYRDQVRAERHFGIFALYKVFFPQLVAGPIERSYHLLPQLRGLRDPANSCIYNFDGARIADGLRLILLGFAKKIILANNLAVFVDYIYNAPAGAMGGTTLAIGTVLFAFQIYFDFSAYTDIARGVARIFGIDLIQNFQRPYLALSIADFWRRWHMSLTSWFRDYVYIPLGGNRASVPRWMANVAIVFLLSGLWHGANWTFLAWGALHAVYFLIGRFTSRGRAIVSEVVGLNRHPALLQVLRIGWTFTIVCFAWIFFRAPDIASALHIVNEIAATAQRILIELPLIKLGLMESVYSKRELLGVAGLQDIWIVRLWVTLAAVAVMMIIEVLIETRRLEFARLAGPWRWAIYYGTALATLLLGNIGHEQFIYFQF
jgi:alginate O-acetyltransferase complex protein AlgI